MKQALQLEGGFGRPIMVDITKPNSENPAKVILFAHGFKGFKDWGHWHLIAQAFAEAGYLFIKFNFSIYSV